MAGKISIPHSKLNLCCVCVCVRVCVCVCVWCSSFDISIKMNQLLRSQKCSTLPIWTPSIGRKKAMMNSFRLFQRYVHLRRWWCMRKKCATWRCRLTIFAHRITKLFRVTYKPRLWPPFGPHEYKKIWTLGWMTLVKMFEWWISLTWVLAFSRLIFTNETNYLSEELFEVDRVTQSSHFPTRTTLLHELVECVTDYSFQSEKEVPVWREVNDWM